MGKSKQSEKTRELTAVLSLIPDDKKSIAADLIKEIVFMSTTLENLKNTIQSVGEVELFEQGKQKFVRENPALKSYNTTIQRYGAMYKQLVDLMPKSSGKNDEDDGFDEFASDRSD